MIITIILSLTIIYLCESEQFVIVRHLFSQRFKFLLGERENIKNIFIGILGSSVVTLIGYILEYFQSVKRLQEDVELYYMHIRTEFFQYINECNEEIIYKIRGSDTFQKIREITHSYKGILDFYLGILEFVNRFIKDDDSKLELLDCNFCSRYVKAAYVLTVLCNYFLIINRNFHCKNIWLNEYKEEYKKCRGSDTLKKALDTVKRRYKYYVQSDKEVKEYISSLRLVDKCKNLDALFVFGVKNKA